VFWQRMGRSATQCGYPRERGGWPWGRVAGSYGMEVMAELALRAPFPGCWHREAPSWRNPGARAVATGLWPWAAAAESWRGDTRGEAPVSSGPPDPKPRSCFSTAPNAPPAVPPRALAPAPWLRGSGKAPGHLAAQDQMR